MALTFNVLIDATGVVQAPDRRKQLSISGADQIRWVASAGGPWAVVFRKTPFNSDSFQVRLGSAALSGPPVNGSPGQVYKYDIRDASGATTDDPEVQIET